MAAATGPDRPEVTRARAAVEAARDQVADQSVRLEAAVRAAADLPGKARRDPVRTAGLAAGAAFVVLGGPGRVVRRVRRAILGPRADLPKSLLPDEVERAVRALGSEGEKVRGALEREFARYLEEHAERRRSRDLGTTAALLLSLLAKPLVDRLGRRLAEELFSADRASFETALDRVRRRMAERRAGSTERSRPESDTESDAKAS